MKTFLSNIVHRFYQPKPQSDASTIPVNFYERDIQSIDADVQYAVSVGQNYIQWLPEGRTCFRRKVVLEIGPGINFGSVLFMACLGAKPMVNDRFLAPWDENYHPLFYKKMRDWIEENIDGADLTPLNTLLQENRYSQNVIYCSSRPLEDLKDIPDKSVDIVFSNAVLEHVYNPPQAFRSLARISKKGAFGLHQVDFRDHRNMDRPLEFLIMKEKDFKIEFEYRNGECGNRWRPAEYKDLFEKSKFRVIQYISTLTINEDYLKIILPLLRETYGSRYQKYPEEDFQSIGGHFIVEKL